MKKSNKIGFVGKPLSGHLNPMTALARRLQSRSNQVAHLSAFPMSNHSLALRVSTPCHTAKQRIPSVLSTKSIAPWL
jgi:UDP:flavonoid glycosyltransferase YjiC (YdhE family)